MVGYGDIDCSVLYKWVIYQQYDNRGHESPSGYVVRSQLRVVNVTISSAPELLSSHIGLRLLEINLDLLSTLLFLLPLLEPTTIVTVNIH